MAKMKPPAIPEQPVPVLPDDALRRLFAACAGKDFEARRDTAMIMLLLDSGARRAELVGLRVDNPADLGSPLSYAVEVLAADDDQDLDPAAAGLSPSRQWVMAALRAGGDPPDGQAARGSVGRGRPALKPRTIQTALGELEAAGLAAGSEEGNGRARYWSPVTPDEAAGERRTP